jgi:hypothetical protein
MHHFAEHEVIISKFHVSTIKLYPTIRTNILLSSPLHTK